MRFLAALFLCLLVSLAASQSKADVGNQYDVLIPGQFHGAKKVHHRHVKRATRQELRRAARSDSWSMTHRDSSLVIPPHEQGAKRKRVQVASASSDLPLGEGNGTVKTRLMPHPAGCPRTLFCGCGVSLYVFGKAVVEGGLAIAKEWLRFPRAEPGPGMVAARRGHVFAIVRDLGHGKVLAYDPNSGGHKTRIHVRSLRGYTVVNPHA